MVVKSRGRLSQFSVCLFTMQGRFQPFATDNVSKATWDSRHKCVAHYGDFGKIQKVSAAIAFYFELAILVIDFSKKTANGKSFSNAVEKFFVQGFPSNFFPGDQQDKHSLPQLWILTLGLLVSPECYRRLTGL
jgi:hypothetical protein